MKGNLTKKNTPKAQQTTFQRIVIYGFILLATLKLSSKPSPQEVYDIVIYGGSSAGVIAAVQAKNMGKSVVIVNPYNFLGGMTSSGLNSADVGNPASISGLTREFFQDMGKEYGADFTNKFEPHIAELAFNDLIKKFDIPVSNNKLLDLKDGVSLKRGQIVSIKTVDGEEFYGKMFIDATYEGDLMAGANVSYTVGRESNDQYDETLNGFQIVGDGDLKRLSDIGESDHFVVDVDPYLVQGDPSSGLLPRINPDIKENGAADHRIQAYNYRLILTTDTSNQIPFTKPEGYQEIDHELMLRNFEAGDLRLPGRLAKIPNQKIDWNTFGAVGTDMAGANVNYAEADHQTRLEIDQKHKVYTLGHFWTLAHHPRVPKEIREEMQRWGYAKDEFQSNNGFPYMIYVREARRMVSDYVMTEHNCLKRKIASDPVALASFAMDSHVVQYIVNERGFAEREGVFLKSCDKGGPYGVSYRSIIPKKGECKNLFVPVCLSATHVAHGSIRMEPVFMGLAQAAATAACIAIDKKINVQDVPYEILKEQLLKDDMMLEWNEGITKK